MGGVKCVQENYSNSAVGTGAALSAYGSGERQGRDCQFRG